MQILLDIVDNIKRDNNKKLVIWIPTNVEINFQISFSLE